MAALLGKQLVTALAWKVCEKLDVEVVDADLGHELVDLRVRGLHNAFAVLRHACAQRLARAPNIHHLFIVLRIADAINLSIRIVDWHSWALLGMRVSPLTGFRGRPVLAFFCGASVKERCRSQR